MYKTFLFIHLISLIVAYGTIVFVDFYGFFWALGKRTNEQVMQVSSPAQILIWSGLTGLVITGIALGPNLSRPLTQLKMVLVVIIFINGINLHFVQKALKQNKGVSFQKLNKKLLFWSVASLTLSQLAWLGAIIAGFIITNS
jgi:hypothetical protein